MSANAQSFNWLLSMSFCFELVNTITQLYLIPRLPNTLDFRTATVEYQFSGTFDCLNTRFSQYSGKWGVSITFDVSGWGIPVSLAPWIHMPILVTFVYPFNRCEHITTIMRATISFNASDNKHRTKAIEYYVQ